MAMAHCKECGEIISDKLKTCPQCGRPPQAVKLPTGLAVAALELGIFGLVLSPIFHVIIYFLGFLLVLWQGYSIFWMCLSFVLILNLLAVTLGSIAIYKARRGDAGGEGEAKIGLVCGVVGIVIIVFWSIFFLTPPTHFP